MTTPYESIYQYIQDDLHRPDLQAEINRRIQRAVQRYHRIDTWMKDHIDQIYVFEEQNTIAANVSPVLGSDSLFMQRMQPPALYIQQIDTTLLTRPRLFSYIRKWMTQNPWGTAIVDPESGAIGTTANGDLTESNPDSLTDTYGYNRTNVFYRSGDKININSSTPLNQVYIGYFSDPVVAPVENLYDWISVDYQSLIVADVVSRTFGVIGKTEEQNAVAKALGAEIALLQSNNIRVTLR